MLKIKVNLDNKSYQTLLSDMKLFKITKSDGSINKNKFMNLLFENYYAEYLKETEEIISNTIKLMKKYNIENNEFASDLALELSNYKHQSINTYYNESLTFYLSIENEFIFNTLNLASNLGASAYFRRLVYRYLEYPQYKREEIIYNHILSPIYKAINNKEMIKLKLDKNEITIKPFKIGTSKEEIYSYLLGLSTNGLPMSIHILKIKVVVGLKTSFSFTPKEEKNLNEVYHLGIQFPFKNICKAEIKLNEAGIKLYESKYLNRPDAVKIEGDHYFFECSFDQLNFYFQSFGNKAKIITPDYLAKEIYKSYKEYIDDYENNK